MARTRRIWPFAREVGRILALCALVALESVAVRALPKAVTGFQGINPWPDVEWQLLAGFLSALALVPVVLRAPWRGSVLFGLLAAVLFYVGHLSNLIEAFIFIPSSRGEWVVPTVEALLSSLAAAALLVAVLDRSFLGEGPAARRPGFAWQGWAWRLAACAASYLAAYFVVGGLMYQAFMAPFYQDPSLGLAAPGGEGILPLLPVQFARGLLLTLAMLPLTLGLRVRRLSLALIVAAILYVVGGLAPLLVPNPFMPDQLRLYHALEILIQNGLLGLAIVLLLAPPRVAASPLAVTASSLQPPSGGSLLAVFAHPDDESFGPAGTLARYAAEGRAVHLLTLTDGALGDLPPEVADSDESLAEVRSRELQCAAKVLGVTALHHFRYRDSGMPGSSHNQHPDSLLQTDSREVIARIAEIIERSKPQVVITHDPTGGYFHPDHIRASELTAAAFRAANGPVGAVREPPLLYYSVIPRNFIRWAILFLRLSGKDPTRFGRNGDVDLTALGTPDGLIDAQVDVSPYLDAKRRAMACHRSQGGGEQAPPLGLPRWLQNRLMGAERFVQGFPPPAAGGGRRSDLFQSL